MRGGLALREVTAGLLVMATAVPLSIGLAAVAGVPPVNGLCTAVWPLVVFAVVGSSPHLKLGMDASGAALVAATVPGLVTSDPEEYVAVAAALTLVTGAIVLLAAVVRLGFLAELVSSPVLVGYTAGVALSVVVGQSARLLGITVDGSGNDLQTAGRVLAGLGQAHVATVAVAVVSFAVLVVVRRLAPGWPAAALVLVGGVVASAVLGLEDAGVAVVGDVPSGLPAVALPDVPASTMRDLLVPALGVALVVAADSVITSRSFAVRLGYRVSANRDLAGVGAANVVSAVTGGMVASASYARTAVAERAGSRSQLSGVVSAVAMIAVLVLLTDVLALTPLVVLAVVVVDAVARLVDPPAFVLLGRVRVPELVLALVTAASVLVLGVLDAIVVGVAGALLLAAADLLAAWRTRTEVPRRLRLGRLTRETAGAGGDVAALGWEGPLIFVNVGVFRSAVIDALHGSAPRVVRLDLHDVTMVDATAAAAIDELRVALEALGSRLEVVGLPGPWQQRVDAAARG